MCSVRRLTESNTLQIIKRKKGRKVYIRLTSDIFLATFKRGKMAENVKEIDRACAPSVDSALKIETTVMDAAGGGGGHIS